MQFILLKKKSRRIPVFNTKFVPLKMYREILSLCLNLIFILDILKVFLYKSQSINKI